MKNNTAPEAMPGQEADREVEILMTASEAFPRLEQLFLEAKTEIWCSFRIFDPETELRSDEGRAIGETWSDLLAHVLDKGVHVRIVLADFDPVMAVKLHQITHRCSQQLRALEGKGRQISVRTALHPARVGTLPRLVFGPIVRRKLARMDPDYSVGPAPGFKRFKRSGRPPLIPATHHQKLAVFDRETLYIGGLDLNERRYDTPEHDRLAEETWQDVICVIEGPVVAAAQSHLETFLDRVADRKREVHRHEDFLVTLSRKRRTPIFHVGPHTIEDTIREAHEKAVARARRFIYLETQFFRHKPLAEKLAEAAARNRDLHLILVLPGAPEDVAFEGRPEKDGKYGEHLQAEAVRTIEEAFGDRLFVGSPVQRRRPSGEQEYGRATLHGAPLIYVHTKVSIFDDDLAFVTSANLNGRSLCWDTEAGVALHSRADILALRNRLFDHCLGAGADETFFAPETAVAQWRRRARENAARAPEDRAGFLVPYRQELAEATGETLPGVPTEMM